MIEFKKIGIDELQSIANCLLENKGNVEKVISDFGNIEINNGYGTIFLQPINQLFKVISIYSSDGQIISVGFGGPHLGLSLESLLYAYNLNSDGFVPYDNDHVYVFYSSENIPYTIKITSKNKLLENGKIINNIPINDFVITMK